MADLTEEHTVTLGTLCDVYKDGMMCGLITAFINLKMVPETQKDVAIEAANQVVSGMWRDPAGNASTIDEVLERIMGVDTGPKFTPGVDVTPPGDHKRPGDTDG